MNGFGIFAFLVVIFGASIDEVLADVALQRSAGFDSCTPGNSQFGGVIRVVSVGSRLRCAKACLRERLCRSFRFNGNSNQCELSSATSTSSDADRSPGDHWAYYCSEDAFADCTEGPMGMEDGRIPDSSITAFLNRDGHRPQNGRLNSIGSWTPRGDDANPWIQVDFQTQVHITGVITQGRSINAYWVRQYQIGFSQDGSTFTYATNAEGAVLTFTGNTDQNTPVTNRLPAPVNSRFLRIYPKTWNTYGTLRFEVIGCYPASDQP